MGDELTNMFHYTVETAKTFEDTLIALKESLKDHKFGVLWEMDVPVTLQSKGFDFTKKYQILEVCNPNQAYKAISQNSLTGYFLPCKIVVYEEGDKIRIGLPKPTVMMDFVNDATIKEIAHEVEDELISAVNEAL